MTDTTTTAQRLLEGAVREAVRAGMNSAEIHREVREARERVRTESNTEAAEEYAEEVARELGRRFFQTLSPRSPETSQRAFVAFLDRLLDTNDTPWFEHWGDASDAIAAAKRQLGMLP